VSGQQQLLRDIERELRATSRMIGRERFGERVMSAMRRVPRETFVPENQRRSAFENAPLPIGCGQTISQPYIVALMTDLLDADEQSVILEIGTGSGYQAAVLSQVVKQVYSVEIIETLSHRARETLRSLNYDNVSCRCGDGYLGWPEHAPYDGILVTAATPEIPQPLIDQLKPDARLVIPVGAPFSYQELMVVEKGEAGATHERAVLGVAFVPLTRREE
jgi:protein-L-isoaspartate(D-aspartate) O-methyltransferase